MNKALSLILAVMMTATSLVGCGGAGSAGSNTVSEVPTYDSLSVGEDYTDLSAEIKVITHRTDIVNTTFAEYVTEFQKLYPNIKISYESITNYAEDMTTRLSSKQWGDICMIPTYIPRTELGNYFQPLCDLSSIEDEYNFANAMEYEGNVYGIPSMGNVQGVVYNKKVFEEAGITELPKTPDEFLDALQTIKDNTGAIPLYTNYAAGWTMSAWDAYISGSATGDADWMNVKMPHTRDPFAKNDDMTGPYAVYYVLYEAVKRGLTEDDPTTTDWEGSKGMMNNGEIATMVLGTWAVPQIQEAGDNGDDIGYMSFPITVDGKQYATAGSDYCYGVNVNSSNDNKVASMLYIKWLTEQSGYAQLSGGVPALKDQELPETLSSFADVELVTDTPSPADEADLATNISNESELSLNADSTHVTRVVEAAINGDETYDDIVADWNEAWNAAMDKYGA